MNSYTSIGVKSPLSIKEFYKRYLKGRMSELKTDIPLSLLVEVNKFQMKYPIVQVNIRKTDAEVIDRVAATYGVSKGNALLLLIFHNFENAKDFLESYVIV